MVRASRSPDWDRLYGTASAQEGYFTTEQARLAGYSPQLLQKHLHAGRVARIRRGIYRLVHFPAGEHEDLAIIWLWSKQAGIFSHQTALALHGLSDVLPAEIHLALPHEWRQRRFRVPAGVVLHHQDGLEHERAWFGPVPVTAPARTLEDCAREHLAPDLLRQAAQQALRRGLVTRDELAEVEHALAPFGGMNWPSALDLDGLRREFDLLAARMQEPAGRSASDALFAASGEALAEAAIAWARGKAR
jgi:predicted transcriptional regulator of viral defense system